MPLRVNTLIALVVGIAASLFGAAASAQPEFSTPLALSDPNARDSGNVRLSSDALGTWIAAWNAGRGNASEIVLARSTDDGETWESPTPLTTPAPIDSGPAIATAGDGTWIVCWSSSATFYAAISFSRSQDDGVTWSVPAFLDPAGLNNQYTDYFPEVTSDGQRHWIAAWIRADNTATGDTRHVMVSRSGDDGVTWTTPIPIQTGIAVSRPELATDRIGIWVAVWDVATDTTFDERDIFASRSTDEGATWSVPQPLNTDSYTSAGISERPVIATDRMGTWVTSWSATGDLATHVESDIVTARSVDGGQAWSTPKTLRADAATDAIMEYSPNIAVDDSGRWLAVWTANPDLTGTVQADEDLLVAESTNGARTWSLPAVLNTTAAADAVYDNDSHAQVVTDGLGTWMTTWVSSQSDSGFGPPHILLEPSIVMAVGHTPAVSGGSSGGCFIATAAYGTPLSSELDRLRGIRDAALLPTAFGAAFTDAYYRLSPGVARWIAPRPVARWMIRTFVGSGLNHPAAVTWAAMMAGVGVVLVVVNRRRARTKRT